MKKSIYRQFPEGPAKPSLDALEAFWAEAKKEHPDIAATYEVRCIGVDEPSTAIVLELIKQGDKTGTFSLPWILEDQEQACSQKGDYIIYSAYDGSPALLVRVTEIERTAFGEINERHTAIDGSPVRDLSVWIPLHTKYWNKKLAPFGRVVSSDMPVIVEKFEMLYAR